MIKSKIKSEVLQLRTTTQTKKTAQKLLESKGLTLSYAINNFLSNLSLHEDALMLAYNQPRISEDTILRWEKEVKDELKHAKKFSNSKEAIRHLKSL